MNKENQPTVIFRVNEKTGDVVIKPKYIKHKFIFFKVLHFVSKETTGQMRQSG